MWHKGTAAHQAPLSFSTSWSLLKFMSIDLMMLFHSLPSPSPFAFNLSQHRGLFQWVSFLYQVAKVLQLQLQQQFFQWIFRVDFLSDWLVWFPCCPCKFNTTSFGVLCYTAMETKESIPNTKGGWRWGTSFLLHCDCETLHRTGELSISLSGITIALY